MSEQHVGDQPRNRAPAKRTPRLPGRRRIAILPAVLAALIIALGFAGQSLLLGAPAHADGRPPGGNLSDPAVRAINITTPAAVRIATIYVGHITLNLTHCGKRITLPASGQGYATGGLGSGAFISANGDILTADHVVNIPRDSLDQEIFQSETAARAIADAINACYPDFSFPITPADVAAGIVGELGISYATSYADPQFLVWRDTAWSGDLSVSAKSEDSILAGLLVAPHHTAKIVASSDFSQDDLAILHVALSDTPSIQLDRSTEVAVEDPLAIIGFPGNGDFSSDPTDLLTASVNNATVSAIKKNDNGSALIQVGGNIEHGDSGGPALNSAGHIIGIVSFGGTDTPGITAFLRASDNAQTLISHAGINTTPGAFQAAWEHAFGEYASTTPGHWHRAASELQALSTKYPEFQGVQPYLHYATDQATKESTTTLPFPTSVPSLALIGGGAGLLVLLIAGGVALGVRSRRRKAQRAAQPAMVAVPAGTYAPPSGYGPGYGPSYGPSYGYGYPSTPYPSPPFGQATAPVSPYPPTPSGPVPYTGMPSGPAGVGPWAGSQTATTPGATRAATPPPAASASGGAPEMCLNGHLMPSGVVTCGMCGAPRRSA